MIQLPPRPARALGALALVTTAGIGLVACGGGDDGGGSGGGDAAGASTSASVKDFCAVAGRIFTSDDLVSAINAKDYDKAADLMHAIGKDLAKVGTPSDMSDDAREGYRLTVSSLAEVSADDMRKAAENPGSNPVDLKISKEDQAKGLAYGSYVLKNCAGAGLPSGLPSDLATLPSDVASRLADLPSEIPSDLASQLGDLPTDPEGLQSYLEKLPVG